MGCCLRKVCRTLNSCCHHFIKMRLRNDLAPVAHMWVIIEDFPPWYLFHVFLLEERYGGPGRLDLDLPWMASGSISLLNCRVINSWIPV